MSDLLKDVVTAVSLISLSVLLFCVFCYFIDIVDIGFYKRVHNKHFDKRLLERF